MRELKIFSGRANPGLATKICGFLNLPLGRIHLADFPDDSLFEVYGADEAFVTGTFQWTDRPGFVAGLEASDRPLLVDDGRFRLWGPVP